MTIAAAILLGALIVAAVATFLGVLDRLVRAQERRREQEYADAWQAAHTRRHDHTDRSRPE